MNLKQGGRIMSGNFIGKADVASSLSRMSGLDFEGAYHKLNSYGSPKVLNENTRQFDVKAFRDVASGAGVSNSSIINECVNRTGRSYESVFIEMSMPKY
jgi:hypothetical protein